MHALSTLHRIARRHGMRVNLRYESAGSSKARTNNIYPEAIEDRSRQVHLERNRENMTFFPRGGISTLTQILSNLYDTMGIWILDL